MSAKSSPRVPWIDHLRTLVILLVVNVHACVTYSHVGDWYSMSEHEPTLKEKIPFIVWEGHLQSFFMGVLFFISGYFAAGSLRRKGSAAFIKERLVRLGLPALFYMLVIHPFILLGLNPWRAKFPPVGEFYARYLSKGVFLGESGPLWFAVALLIFCLVYTGISGFPAGNIEPVERPPKTSAAPGGWAIIAFALMLGLASALTRLVFPIGTDVQNFQLCFFPQYIAAFTVGIMAARRGWLLALAGSPQAARAGSIALIGGPIVLLALMFIGGQNGHEPFTGGWHWQAWAHAFWEQCTGVGLSLGLMSVLSRHLNRDGPCLHWLSDRAFAVYVLHAPVLIALMMMFRVLPQNPYALAALLTVVGLVMSYSLADVVRRIPGLRGIF
ncbi:MAG: acyltransferase family protein [Opitutus sp.]